MKEKTKGGWIWDGDKKTRKDEITYSNSAHRTQTNVPSVAHANDGFYY